MNINGTHVQGIFKYNSSLEYEKGDFVIDGDVLYVCTAEASSSSTIIGQQPSLSPGNFKVYLGDKISSVSEYFNYLNSPEYSEDKYISTHTLSGILNHYMFGLDERGIIKEYVKYGSSTGIEITQGLGDLLSNGPTPDGILGEILRSNSLNNALLMISTRLPEISNLDGDPKTEYVQLRQTTYTDPSGQVRIQELINPVKGKVWWRATSPGNWLSVTSWKSSFYSDQVKSDLDSLHNYYQQKIEEVEVIKEGLKKTWRYESMSFLRRDNVIIECNSPIPTNDNYGYLPVPAGSFIRSANNETVYKSGLEDRLVIQICLRVGSGEGIRSASITIDLMDYLVTSAAHVESYNVGGLATLTFEYIDTSNIRVRAVANSGYTNPIIYNIFYKKYYG